MLPKLINQKSYLFMVIFNLMLSLRMFGVIQIDNFSKQMSLLGSQGGRGNEKSIKETLLNEQIAKLREIYQDSSTASEKVLNVLRKVIDFKQQHRNHKQQQGMKEKATVMNHFMEDLSSVEDCFITLIQNCEADKQQFVSSAIFRDSEKQLTSLFFKKMMKSHQDFKERLNLNILRLEKDIQNLQSNGFHIYSPAPKPNNVLSTLKKHNLDKYIVSRTEMQTVFDKMKGQMSNKLILNRREVKSDFRNEVQKLKEYGRIAEQIFLKEKLRSIMLTEEISNIRAKVATQARKIKLFEQSLKKSKKEIKGIYNQIAIESQETFSKSIFREYIKKLKESADAHMMFTPKLYKTPMMRSKSCPTVIATQKRPKEYNMQRQMKESEQSAISSQKTIIGYDFMEQSVQS